MKTNEERLQDMLDCLGSLSHVKAREIPDIDLYMDQVTTFMDHDQQLREEQPAPSAGEEKIFQRPHADAGLYLLF